MHGNWVRSAALLLLTGVLLPGIGQRGGRLNTFSDASEQPPQRVGPSDTARAKAERDRNIQDATRLSELADKIKRDLSASSSFTLSLATVKDSEEMAKLSKKLHSRLKSDAGKPDTLAGPYDASQGTAKQ